jgi:hypothetical protein
MVLDTQKFLLTHWPAQADLVNFLQAWSGDEEVRKGMVAQWYARQRIPTAWFPRLLVALEIERGAPISLRPFLVGQKA